MQGSYAQTKDEYGCQGHCQTQLKSHTVEIGGLAHVLSSSETCKFESDTPPELSAPLLAAIDVWIARSLEQEAAATSGTYSLKGAPVKASLP